LSAGIVSSDQPRKYSAAYPTSSLHYKIVPEWVHSVNNAGLRTGDRAEPAWFPVFRFELRGVAMRFPCHFARLDSRAVMVHLGRGLQLIGAIFLGPVLVALFVREFYMALVFFSLTLGTAAVGAFFYHGEKRDLEIKEALVVTALVYLIFGFVGALAFLPFASFTDGFFEAMSGITTTGLTVLDVERLPRSVLFFRSYSQWVGGAGIIVLSLCALLGPGKAAFQLYASEFRGENLAGSVIATARIVLKVYLLLTAVCFLVYTGAGMRPFDAALNVMATVSTGGFSQYNRSIGQYAGPESGLVRMAVTGFMFLGAVSLPLFFLGFRHGASRFFQELQLRCLAGIVAGTTLLFFAFSGWNVSDLQTALFRATTCVTTTGFSIDDPAAWSDRSKFLGVLLMMVGGSAGSTAGGIKIFRLLLLFKLAAWFVTRSLLPEEAKLSIKYGGVPVSDGELKQVGGFLGLYVAFLAVSTLMFVTAGFGCADALFESASALGTVGLSSGITSGELSWGLKVLLIFNMWAGRLEILPVLVALHPGAWMCARRPV